MAAELPLLLALLVGIEGCAYFAGRAAGSEHVRNAVRVALLAIFAALLLASCAPRCEVRESGVVTHPDGSLSSSIEITNCPRMK